MQKIINVGLVPVGLQVMSLSNSTAIGINSTVRASQVLNVSVETAAARYRCDAAPTNTTGVYLAANSHTTFNYNYVNGTTNLRFVKGSSTASVVTIQGWRYAGSPTA